MSYATITGKAEVGASPRTGSTLRNLILAIGLWTTACGSGDSGDAGAGGSTAGGSGGTSTGGFGGGVSGGSGGADGGTAGVTGGAGGVGGAVGGAGGSGASGGAGGSGASGGLGGSGGSGGTSPELLATAGIWGFWGLALDDSNVYLAEATRVSRIAKSGGSLTIVAYDPLAATLGVNWVVVDATSTYWGGQNGVFRVQKAGGTPANLDSSTNTSSQLAVDAADLFWLGSSAVKRVTKNGGGAAVTLATDAAALDAPITIDSTYAYYVADAFGGTIQRIAKSGGVPSVFANTSCFPDKMTADANYLYWGGYDSSSNACIERAALAGGAVEPLATFPGGFRSLALDGINIYAATVSEVLKIPLAGGTPTTLATGQTQINDIAVDSSHVYWVTAEQAGSGLLLRLAK